MAKTKKVGTESLLTNTWKNKTLFFMSLPAVLFTLVFCYIPMSGLVLAFKRYNFADGIFGSPWAGWSNFEFFIKSGKLLQLTANTFYYNIVFLVSCVVLEVTLAVFLSEVNMNAKVRKVCQTMSLLPHFVSYVVVGLLFFNIFNYDFGVLNSIIEAFGGEPISLYQDGTKWRWLIPVVNAWKGVGYGSIVYLAATKGIDPNLYEAAAIDGAGAWKRVWCITLPLLKPTIVTMTLLSLGRIMRGNYEMFYQLVGVNPNLTAATDIIDTYVFRAVTSGTDYGMTSAATLYQSVLCFVMIVGVNKLIKLWNKDYALF